MTATARRDVRSPLVVAGLLAASVASVAWLQPPLAAEAHRAGQRHDPLALPPPEQLKVATLGWDAAAVDLLWSALLVAHGSHWADHVDFTDTPRYADSILELEPGYAPLYRYIDTMLAYRPLQGTEADVRLARQYLERGTRERPYDGALWMRYGQFLAFIAPSFLTSSEERASWRFDGAEAMSRAIDLGADAERALTVASLLGQSGQSRAAIASLERAYAFTEHPAMAEEHQAIGRRLAELRATGMRDEADRAFEHLDTRRAREMPYLSHDEYLLLGPARDVARCAGLAGADDPGCADALEISAP